MIPILYDAAETVFTHNGLGVMAETSKCEVREERNGEFEATLEYPVDGKLYPYISEGCIIKAKPDDTRDPQLFKIYKSARPMNGIVTYYGRHISYDLSGNPIEEVTIQAGSAQTALERVLAAGLIEHNFRASSDIETLNSTSLSLLSIRAALGGVEGSILDVWGGEYEFDNFVVRLHKARGRNTGIKVAYGKNLTDMKQERNISEVYTAVLPYAKYTPEGEPGGEKPEEVTITLSEKIVYGPHANEYAHTRVAIMDFTQAFAEGEEITEAALRSKATTWAESSGFDMPSVNISVSFQNLWQSPEYASYAPLERVGLCDTVTVEFPKLGIQATAKVIKTVYDVLKERYISIELGNAKSNFADTINSQTKEISGVKQEIKKQTTAANIKLAEAIARTTAAITGQSGGNIVLNPPENPQEILALDAPTIAEAKRILRINLNGIGFSKNGYNGPFPIAITIDGEIVADYITAGTLNGELLKADSVKANAISVEYKTSVTDQITDKAVELEQQFKASDQQLLSMIGNVQTSLDGTIARTTQLEQTADGLQVSISKVESNQAGTQGEVEDIRENGVDKVQNTTVTIDINGIAVGKSGSEFSTLIDDVGVHLSSRGTEIANFTPSGTDTKNLNVQEEMTVANLRIIKGTEGAEKRCHIHFVG